MSQTYVAQIVLVLALVLPKFGITLGNDEITAAVQGVLVAGTVIWTLYRRWKAGGVTPLGAYKH